MSDLCLSLRVIQKSVHTPACPVILSMSVEEVERVLLYSLEASVSPEERKRQEAQDLITEMSKSIENAGYLFQLLLKYELSQETVSLRIIKILESYLVKIDGAFCSQLRAAFISEFLEKIIIGKSSKVPSDIKSFTKNAIVQFLLTAFIKERLLGTWPDSISSLLSILKDSQVGREIFLKFCLMLTEEISGSQAKGQVSRNAELRDSMRLGDNAVLCSFWKEILKGYAEGSREMNYSSLYVVLALECFASYANWIDVGLVVEGETLKLIYFLLQSQDTKIQLAAADCLAEIVSKGMSATDKISLANYMNLTSVFDAVSQRGILDSFFCKICRVLCNLGCSLGQQIQLTTPQSSIKIVQDQVVQFVCPVLLPYLLSFLQIFTTISRDSRDDSWEDGLTALLPFIANIFDITRGMRDNMRSDQIDFMGRFLPICIDLVELSDDEAIFSFEDDEEDSMPHYEIRNSLLQAFDSVLWLQGHATLAMLNEITKKESCLTLGKCELLARIILRIPERMRGQPTFSLSINGQSRMTPISELVTWTFERIPENFPRLIPLICDILVRYSSSSYLDVFPDRIENCLRLLMKLLEMRSFKEADCEKMLKFVKNLKGKLGAYSSVLLTALQQRQCNGTLKLSCSLYEIAGLSIASIDPRAVHVEGLTATLLQGALETSMRSDGVIGLDCLGFFAKGFMTDTCLDPFIVRSWFREYCNGFLLGNLKNHQITGNYLNSCISFSQRIIPLLQGDSIPLVREISIRIISTTNDSDGVSLIELMSQLLSLLSASIFKLKEQFSCPEVLGQLWRILLPRVNELFNGPIQGTDDLIQSLGLSKAWLSFLQALSTSNGISFTIAIQNNSMIEATFLKIIEKVSISTSSNSTDIIAILRSLCGVVNRCQSHLSREFINCNLIPVLLHRTLPELFQSLDPSSKKNLASIPASLLNLLQDLILMIRGLMPNGNLNSEWMFFNRIDLVGCDVKESRTALANYYFEIISR